MNVLRGDHSDWPQSSPTKLTIGVFDGVHRGHRKIFDTLRAAPGEGELAVVTFSEHPALTLRPGAAPRMLTTLAQRIELFGHLGAGTVAVLDFPLVRELSPDQFVHDVLVDKLRASWVAVGSGFRFGHQMEGDEASLRALGARYGFGVDLVEIVGGDSPVSSTAIRGRVAEGDMVGAATMLGRPFQLRGGVVVGDRRGRQLGFPTANLEVGSRMAVPARGVYSALTHTADGRVNPSVVNVGVRPTFGGEVEVVEVHLLDVSTDLYGQELRVDFVDRIRPERRFNGVAALVDQIRRDIDSARLQLNAAS